MPSDSEQELNFFGPPTLKLLVDSAEALSISRRFNYAFFTFMVWDLVLTFPREVSKLWLSVISLVNMRVKQVTLIWSSRLTLVKILFLFNRYISLLVMAVNVWCTSPSRQREYKMLKLPISDE